MKRHVTALCAFALLTACESSEPTPEPSTNVTVEKTPEPAAPANVTTANLSAGTTDAMPALNLAPDELTLVLDNGSARHVSFGMAQAAALTMVAASLGNPIEEGQNEECGAGPLGFAAFRGGLSLYFEDGKFAGWDVDGRDGGKFSTANGVGIGSTRKQIEAASPVALVPDSTIGIEFTIGEMSGLLSARTPEATVTNLWAGTTCIAR